MRLLSAGLVGLALALAPCMAPSRKHRSGRSARSPDRAVPSRLRVDALARAVAQALGENLGKPFIVDNRAGAGGNLGARVAKASADGYTLLFGTPAPIALNKLMYKGLTFDSEKDSRRSSLPSSRR